VLAEAGVGCAVGAGREAGSPDRVGVGEVLGFAASGVQGWSDETSENRYRTK
jgi:hypothetical protein